MIFYKIIVICVLSILCFNAYVDAVTLTSNHALDLNLYEEVIDLEQCEQQLTYITQNNTALRNRFMDASFRLPRSILRGNTRDTGNYFQCLDISQQTQDMKIEGKYSVVQIPLQQDNFELPSLPDLILPDIPWPELPWPEWNPNTTHYNEELLSKLNTYEKAKNGAQILLGHGIRQRVAADSPLAGMQMELAFCIPKVCTAKHAFDVLTTNMTANLTVIEAFVRLPNDKTWVAADYVAVILFSMIGLLTVLCTSYDIWHTILLKKDPKKVNKICTLFSVYTNTKEFFVFSSSPNVITCLDGIRSFAMMWVIVGHVFLSRASFIPQNPLDLLQFVQTFGSIWITSSPITVDTFFMISGLLVVYTTAAKVSRISLFKKIHLFYLSRIFRMFPILGAVVLINASFLHRLDDGPYWHVMVQTTNNCRVYWWSTLLFVQNWVNPLDQCIGQAWYLAIDMQLHILSPILLFWILGQRSRVAWTALAAALTASMIGATTYNFINNFQSALVTLGPNLDSEKYMINYYFNILNRISPFVIGTIVGYILHLYRGKTVVIPWVLAGFLWIVATATTSTVILTTYYNTQMNWDNQLADNFINSFKRPVWAACIGWLVVACKHGYGGPINWVLSLHIFKILGRLSYSMYIVHNSIIFLTDSVNLQPLYFTLSFVMHKFLIDFTLTVIGGFLLLILIDSPFSNIIKMFLGGGPRPPPKEAASVLKEPEIGFTAVSVVHNVRDAETEKAKL